MTFPGRDPEALAHLPDALATAERLAREWNLRIEGPLPGATCSLVLAASTEPPLPSGGEGGSAEGRDEKKIASAVGVAPQADGGEGFETLKDFVLRMPLLDWERGTSKVLKAFAPHGGVRIVREDPESGAVLLPRLRPGLSLDSLPEDQALDVWIALAHRLQNAEGDAPSVEAYLVTLWTQTTGLRLKTDAPALARRLLETSLAPSLLHGDLHHFNVLRHGDEWVAIDPEGVFGDPAYEAAAFLRNPVPALGGEPDLKNILEKRILRIAEGLDQPAERIWGWALVRTALCVWREPTSFGGAWLTIVHALDSLAPEFDEP